METLTLLLEIFEMRIQNLSKGISTPGGVTYRIDDSYSNDQVTSVSFSDSFGNFMKVEIYPIPRDISDILRDKQEAFQQMMGSLFHDGMSSQFKNKKTAVLEEYYFFDEELGHSYF